MEKITQVILILVLLVLPVSYAAGDFAYNRLCSLSEPLDVNIVSPLEDNDAVPVNIQDQHTTIIDLYLHEHGNDVIINGSTAIGDRTILLVAGHGVVVGNFIGFTQGEHFYEGEVLIVDVNNITLDSPLDFGFNSSAGKSHIHQPNLNVDGSDTTRIFHIHPPDNQSWDITRIIFMIEDNSAMDSAKFGGITALTNGIVIRAIDE